MERKKIHIPTLEERTLKAVFDGENGADYRVLEVLMGSVLDGRKIDPDFQRVANAIVAQCILIGKLPPKSLGRPNGENEERDFRISARYYELIDGGSGYAKSVAALASEFHKDERQIMRIVKEGKKWIGETKDDRDRNRSWWKLCAEMDASARAKGGKSLRQLLDEQLVALSDGRSKRDPLAELDDLIDAILDSRFAATDKK